MSGFLRIAKLGLIDYAVALELQQSLVEARMRDQIADTLLLLEHSQVYTLGRGADERFILNRPLGVPIYRVSRGGQVTYHGPGQLIGYPILKLEGADRDVLRYLRRLERVIMDALAASGIESNPCDGLTGVWIGDRKIGSIGVGIRRWVTLHGFAINVTTDLGYFDRIVPCGIQGCRTTSIAAMGRADVTFDQFTERIAAEFGRVFGYAETATIDPAGLLPAKAGLPTAHVS
jgi:lipoyl(octanoyl) transferase